MAQDNPFETEDRGEITILRVHRVKRGLAVTDARQMDRLWAILNGVAQRRQPGAYFGHRTS